MLLGVGLLSWAVTPDRAASGNFLLSSVRYHRAFSNSGVAGVLLGLGAEVAHGVGAFR